MKTIYIGFSRPKNVTLPVFSWAIRAVYRTPYSHSYLRFTSQSLNRCLIYEAVGKGLRFIGLNLWNTHAECLKEFKLEVTDDQYTALLQYCVDNAGLEYGMVQSFGIFIGELARSVGIDVRKNLLDESANHKICSEVVAEVLISLGVNFSKDLNLITPKDIYCKLLELQECEDASQV